jgi:hypothetical protein
VGNNDLLNIKKLNMNIFLPKKPKATSLITLLMFVLFYPIFLNAQVFTDSNLPIVIINTDGGQEIPDDPRIFGEMKIIYKGEGIRNYLSDQNNPAFLNYNGRIDIEIRGSSSQSLDKKQYGFSTKLANNTSNNNVSLLGMSEENDWILNSLAFDPSLIRDYLSYNISRRMGNYATRTAYCEVVINGAHKGLYVLQEKVKADSGRVDVTKITTSQNTLPNLSGGYITKADKTTGGDPVAWAMSSYTGSTTDFIHELPKAADVTAQQNSYIFSQFNALKTTAFNNNISFINGYPSIIDVPSFVDFMLSNELASNSDGYQLSTYFHKDRNGKLRAGPIWDFNLTYGNDLFFWGFDRSRTDVWQFSNGDNEGAKFWTDLFNNSEFKCYLSKRFNEVTQPGKPMNLNELYAFIDSTITYIKEASIREQDLWGKVPNQTDEVNALKTFLSDRISWMNTNLGSFSDCNSVKTPPLVIAKIDYNPITNATFSSSSDQEFIEIKNIGTQSVDLTGIYFSGTGFVYQFSENQTLASNTSVFLASKATTFTSKYGFAPFGEFTRNLSNSNQDLVLADGFGNVIDKVHYYDVAPWPNADGNGNYLRLIDVNADNSLASNWVATNTNLLSNPDFESNNSIQIYQIPIKNALAIKTTKPFSQIQLVDVQGRIITSVSKNSTEIEIDMNNISNGIYVVKIISKNSIDTRKIIKQ